MKIQPFINLVLICIIALIRFIIGGWIGWLGIILIFLKSIDILIWPWWISFMPIIYGCIYCIYMTIDGVKFRNGIKDSGSYALKTQGITIEQSRTFQIQTIIGMGPQHIGETIERLSKIPDRLEFNQLLLNTALEYYELEQLAINVNNNISHYITIEKWIKAGLVVPV
jgi:hypothetical protein